MRLNLLQYPNIIQHGLSVSCTYNCLKCGPLVTTAVWLNEVNFSNGVPTFECPIPDQLKNVPRSQFPYVNKFDVRVEVTDGLRSVPLYQTKMNIYESCQSFAGPDQCQKLYPSCTWNFTAIPAVCAASNTSEAHLNAELQAKIFFITPTWCYLSRLTVISFFGDNLSPDVIISVGNNVCENIVMKQEGRLFTCEIYPSESSSQNGFAEIRVNRLTGESIPCLDCAFSFGYLHSTETSTSTSTASSSNVAQTQWATNPADMFPPTRSTPNSSSNLAMGVVLIMAAIALVLISATLIVLWRSKTDRQQNDLMESRALRRLSREFTLNEATITAAQRAIPEFERHFLEYRSNVYAYRYGLVEGEYVYTVAENGHEYICFN